MATLSDLVAALAAVTRLPEATVFAYGRFAREAGLINQRGRGRGAAKMTVRDGANLLMAIGGSSITREGGRAIRRFRPMPGRVTLVADEFAESFCAWLKPLGVENLERMRSLPFRFGDFLEFLIQQAGTGELARFMRTIPTADVVDPARWAEKLDRGMDELFEAGIFERISPTMVRVGIDVLLSVKFVQVPAPRIDVELQRYWDDRQDLLLMEFYPRKPHLSEPDHFSVTAEVTLNTITALGFALSDVSIPRSLRSPEDFSRFLANYEPGST